jgi:hypothetical protein
MFGTLFRQDGAVDRKPRGNYKRAVGLENIELSSHRYILCRRLPERIERWNLAILCPTPSRTPTSNRNGQFESDIECGPVDACLTTGYDLLKEVIRYLVETLVRVVWHFVEAAPELRILCASAGKLDILPARFNDTLVPGMTTTVGFVDLRNTNPGDVWCRWSSRNFAERSWMGQTLVNHTIDRPNSSLRTRGAIGPRRPTLNQRTQPPIDLLP